jgi:hypothetical protein
VDGPQWREVAVAICKIGRETIARTELGTWYPVAAHTTEADAWDHHTHEPAVMVTVEMSTDDSEPCVACAWGTNPAAYRVAGDVWVCRDHLASGVGIATAYLAAKAV